MGPGKAEEPQDITDGFEMGVVEIGHTAIPFE
jgi:hypothetical protein